MFSVLKDKKGIIFSCAQGKEKDAKREALNVLETVMEDQYQDKDEEDGSFSKKDTMTAAEELSAELARMREDSKMEKFQYVDVGIRGVILIRFSNVDCDPDEVVTLIFQKMSELKKSLFKICMRLLYPVSIISKATIESIQEICKDHVSKSALSSIENAKTFRIVFKKSLNGNIRRLDVIKAIASFADPKHKVEMKSPDVTIIVYILKNLCTVAVSSNHHRFCDYSVEKFLNSL